MEQLGSHWTDFYEILYFSIVRKYFENIQVSLKSDKNKGTLHEDRFTFFIISRSVLRMINVSDKRYRENQNTDFMLSKFFFLENRAGYEIMWKNIVEADRPQMII